MDLEDFIVSNNLLPLGSLGYVLFCTKKNGWGWNSFLEEINQGEGWMFPAGIKGYMSYGLPLLIIIIYLKGGENLKGIGILCKYVEGLIEK